jgi:heme-degrading monooxygenase HmoA
MLVTMHVWRIPTSEVPKAILRMATQRRPVRRAPGCTFAKLLGTGAGRTFTPNDADLHQWAVLACWQTREAALAFSDSKPIRAWESRAASTFAALMQPLASHGQWSKREPFGQPVAERWTGAVAALTRARIKTRFNASFWSSVPPVTASLHAQPGLLGAIGIGEAPIGLQGTFSVWRSNDDIRAFAYRSAPHQTVIERTKQTGWYAEELFARFAILDHSGTLGANPINDPPAQDPAL